MRPATTNRQQKRIIRQQSELKPLGTIRKVHCENYEHTQKEDFLFSCLVTKLTKKHGNSVAKPFPKMLENIYEHTGTH